MVEDAGGRREEGREGEREGERKGRGKEGGREGGREGEERREGGREGKGIKMQLWMHMRYSSLVTRHAQISAEVELIRQTSKSLYFRMNFNRRLRHTHSPNGAPGIGLVIC